MSVTQRIGIDFGTTNSALACVRPGAAPLLVTYAPSARRGPTSGGPTGRSVIFFHPERRDLRQRLLPWAGPEALDAYLEALDDGVPGRLMQSLKSHLAAKTFSRTQVFGTSYDLSELVAVIVSELVRLAAVQLGTPVREAVVGRPVRFAAAETPEDDALAETRLRAAFARAGVDQVVFEHEPVAAAHFYDASLDHDELVLIADFGGGTSDFSLMRAGPGARSLAPSERILGTSGVALAGDAFDRRIVEHVVAPRLGQGTHYRAPLGTNRMPVPSWVFQRLRAWHHLSFLKSPDTLHSLREVLAGAEEPALVEALIHLVEADLGYALYAAVERTKAALSRADQAELVLQDGPVDIRATVRRDHFEEWIAPDLARIFEAVDSLFASTGVDPQAVDAVFLTGGTAFVPALRRGFEARFGASRLRGGNELTSVAVGLALRAQVSL